MFKTFRFEIYKMSHSRAFVIMFLIVFIASIVLASVGMWKETIDVIVFSSPDNDKFTEAVQLIRDEYNMHAMYLTKHQIYSFSTDILPLLEEGGKLHERLGWLLEQPYEEKKQINEDLYSTDMENIKEKWTLRKSIENSIGIFSFVGIVLVAFLFGREFSNRTISSPIVKGEGRTETVMGKLLSYLFLTIVLSVLHQIASMALYNPTVFSLGVGYIVRCVATCSIVHIGLCSMPIIFAFIFRDIAKSMGVYFLFNILFLSNRRIVGVDIMAPYLNSGLWSDALSFGAFLSVLFLTVAIFLISWTGSVILFNRVELK